MAQLFFSYSHKDEDLRDQLETHLAVLKRQGFIGAWHDRRITAGENVGQAISASLEAADVILLLVSADFLASDYCYELEMTRAMARHDEGAATVIPVILRPCDWHDTPFGKLLAAPRDGKPITQWADRDEAFLDVTRAIKAALKKRGEQKVAAATPTLPANSGARSPDIRSSNLRVAKQFADRDRDRFRHEAFDYVARFFENSLEELARRNPGIEADFRRIDANRFTAVAYRNGEAAARCTVFLGDRVFGGGIGYSANDSGATNSYNESLSVENDDQALYLRPMGMRSSSGDKAKLTEQGAAEFFWEMFIEPLQH
jgi:hypothetical protein